MTSVKLIVCLGANVKAITMDSRAAV